MTHPVVAIDVEDPESAASRACLDGYYRTLSAMIGEPFDPAASLDPERDALRPPLGAFFVARVSGDAVGCCALKGSGGPIGEIKRLWVGDKARGLGAARLLMTAAEARARELGMTTLRLDTNRALTVAIAMYRKHGWREIPAFNTEPYAHHWFEKTL
ncbi:MAG: GNAT family N-acetyltransferase [Pseudomonadota bacterium]